MKFFGKIKQLGRGKVAALLEGLFPRNCIFCEKSREGGGEFLCGLCEQEIVFIDPPYCYGCGIPADISYDTPKENFECALCRKNSFAFDLTLRGSQEINFVPLGEITNVYLSSNWLTPSFKGEFLPK